MNTQIMPVFKDGSEPETPVVKRSTCRHCHGVREFADTHEGRPWGWYSISCSVPSWMGKNGKPYVWIGVWCSAACLAADMPKLQDQEELARMAYAADLPET